ncbi:hypothetical protein JTE90_007781 [Oedothorax gibbosus]|uniref:Medium-chain acyl-CoA ligase ACSF2, mitochondrial n=1 Tax=Oedothorax gibbosus TaxID=931172 RepID=A0AAV6TS38_9ARAC|nr:hypothetical protein JTE90_007781 [Oedothorax gibbosus]
MIKFLISNCLRQIKRFSLSQVRYISDVQRKIQKSYYFMHGDFNLSSSTVGEVLNETADKHGDNIAFISSHQGISKNYSEFRKETEQLASGLISNGLKRGDRIAICAPNCYEWAIVQFAAAKAGLILVTLNPALRPNELKYYLNKVRCKALVSWDVLKTQDFYDIYCELIPELPKCNPNQLKTSNLPHLEKIVMISKEQKEGTLNFMNVFESSSKESYEALSTIENSIQFDDPVNIQFTSGTTGMSKGATLSHHNIVNNSVVSGRRLGYNLTKPIICCQVPLFHCFGCVFGTLMSVIFQGTCIFPSPTFDANASLKTIEQHGCNIVYGTPTMYVDLLHNYRSHQRNIASLKQAVIGGAPATEPLVRDVRNELQLSSVHMAYGSTENSPCVALNGINDSFENACKEVLQPVEYVEVKVVDDKQHLLPINMEGELCVRGHGLFRGYWDDEQRTAEVVDEKTFWYHTGDLCVMNEYGFLKISGRKKDMIIRGGENIYPLEIENFLNSHPDILEAHIVGVPDKRRGEEVCAWISVKEGADLTEEEVKKYCKGKISHFKVPRYIMFVKEFPKTASQKVKKFEMKNISIKELNL